MKLNKRILSIILIFILAISLTGCGEIKKAETAVNGMFIAFKNLEFDEAQKYINVEDITNSDEELTENVQLIMETVFNKLDYKIIASNKVDKNTVIVKTEITAIDMKPVMVEFIGKALEYAFANAFADPQPSEEETSKKTEEILVECATKPDLKTVTTEVDIKVVRTKNKAWKIESDDALTNALLGDLKKATEEIEKSLNEAK